MDRIGEIFLKKKLIQPEHLETALAEQVQTGEFLGEILIRMGYASEQDVLIALAEQCKTRFVRLEDMQIQPQAVQTVAADYAMEHGIMPLSLKKDILWVAIANPLDVWPLSQLQERLHLADVLFVLACKEDIQIHLKKNYNRG